ncbi:LysR family transcriptional regulator [Zavarzinia sp. CC-PAN008]|uniref:LysR family transcriptional regulator n=1 Tax=Zavarzinia sp. CC-PAN008 TaxID=3243332 RepID=UPI003F74397E
MNVSLRVLRYFVAAAAHGNLTAAAAALNVSQPSISMAIAELEGTVGAALFLRRHARGVVLTPQGREVERRARELLARVEDFSTSINGLGTALRGPLQVGVLSYLVPRYVAGLVAAFAQAQPEIDVTLHEGDHHDLLARMQAGQVEALISYDVLVPPAFTAEVLLDLPPYVLVAADHPLAGRSAIALGEIVDEPCVMLDLPVSRDYYATLFGAAALRPRVAHRTNSVEAVRSLVANGLGYTILNHTARSDRALDGRRVQAIALTDRLPVAHVVSVRLAGTEPRAAVAAFLDAARRHFRQEAQGAAPPRQPS